MTQQNPKSWHGEGGLTASESSATESAETESHQLANVPIEDLLFDVRTTNCLQRANIHSLFDLAGMREEDLLKVRHLGERGASQIKETLACLGIHLPFCVEHALATGIDLDAVRHLHQRQAEATLEPPENIPIDQVELTIRAHNCLRRAGVNRLFDLAGMSESDLLAIGDLGQVSGDNVIGQPARMGIRLPFRVEDIMSSGIHPITEEMPASSSL